MLHLRSLLVGLFLMLALCGFPSPIAAQPLSTQAEFLMANKPLFSFSGSRPVTLGVKNGALSPCPSSPNCVCSQTPASDPEHAIAAIAYQTSAAEVLTKLKATIQGMDRTQIITEADNYLYAEFTSALMGFVDDVEFYVDDAAKVVHVRSASRLGQSDLGVNRKRVEAIRSALT